MMLPANITLITIFAKEIEMKFSKIELDSEHCREEVGELIRGLCKEGILRCNNIVKIMGDEKDRQDRIEKQDKEEML